MKKTLLMAAAALAAGIISSQAQPVYSQNVVGYVNTALPAGVLKVVSPALDIDGTGTNNTITTVFGTNSVTLGDVIFAFNGTGYDILNYTTVGRPPSAVTGWFLNGVLDNNYPLNPGKSVFYSSAVNETNTQVGTVLQGTNLPNAYVAGAAQISMVASIVPLAGGVSTTLQYKATLGDVIFNYNGSGYDIYNYTTVGRPPSAVTGWYSNGALAEPSIPVASGFWLQTATSTNWVQNFIVQ